MRSSSFSRNHPYAKTRGWVSPKRAASSLPTITDGVNEVDDASEIWVRGGTVDEPEEGVARISFGGQAIGSNSAGGGGSGTSSAFPVRMFNNGTFALIPGDVVVTDPDQDSAVETTATASNTRIAGVVQAPMDVGEWGPVLFNGYTSIINTTGVVPRGSYALTSATARLAGATAARVAGSFAVYLTGTDFPDFATESVTTEEDVATTSLDIDMPATPAGRVLFLALWLESGASAVSVSGWTLIGSESGFYYYYKTSEGDDTAEATWTGASLAVATVLLLNPSVSLSVPIASHDYDTSTSAAALSGLDTAIARYAVAGVQDVVTPGSGFTRLGGGTAGFISSGTPALIQSELSGSPATFGSTVTPSNVMIAVPFTSANDTYSTDPRQGVICSQDSNMTKFGKAGTNFVASSGANSTAILGKVIGDSYSGPFGTISDCGGSSSILALLEFSNIGVSGAEVLYAEGQQDDSTIDLGTFSGVGADDLIIMAFTSKRDGYSGFDPVVNPNGFTEVVDEQGIVNGWTWLGYKIGDGDASVTFADNIIVGPGGIYGAWAAIAVKLTQGTTSVGGTLAGKYIGHDAAVTSPFTGGGAQEDALFAFNLLQDAKASALLYGPDLGGSGGSEPTADAHIADTSDAHDASAVSLLDSAGLFAATDIEAAIAELAAKDIGYQAHGAMGATETFSAATGWHSGTLNADCTFTLSGATSGIVASMVLELLEDGTGTWAPTWPGSVVWPGGVTPTHNETAGTTTIYLLQSRDGGTTWYGFQSGGSSVGELDDLSDVTITAPGEDDDLRYNGSQWVNDSRKWEAVTDGEDVFVWAGDDLVHEWETY